MSSRMYFDIPSEKVTDFCKRNHINKLSLFGSILRGDFSADSDIDLLAEFETGNIPGLIRLAGMEVELARILGHKVDLRTAEDLSRYFRQHVVDLAEVLYAQG